MNELSLAAIVGVSQLRGHVGDVGVVVHHKSGVVASCCQAVSLHTRLCNSKSVF
jgi:hypothetical protein